MSQWQMVTLGEVTECLDGRRIPLNSKHRALRPGRYPYWGSTGIVDHIDEYLFDEPLVLISEDGGAFDEWYDKPQAFYIDTPVWVNNHIHVLRAKKAILPKWLYYTLVHRDIQRFLKGATRPKLNQADMKRIPIPLPPISTQAAIVALLDSAERCSAPMPRLIAAKRAFQRGLVQDLLTGRRRFPGFGREGEWRVVSLGSLTTRVTRRNTGGEAALVLTCSGEHGLIDQRDYFSKNVAGESLDGYFILRRGEFAYNRSTMKGYPFGTIKRLDRYDAGVLSTLNICFRLSEDGWDPDFAIHYFESGLLNTQLSRIARVGSRAHGLLNVTAHDFFALKVPVPGRAEQQRIAGALNALAGEISSLTVLASQTAALKRGLLQRLLSGDIAI